MADSRDTELELLRRRVAELEEERRRQLLAFTTFMENAAIGAQRYALAPDGRLLFKAGNDVSQRMLGVDNAALVGRPMEEAFPMLADARVASECARRASQGRSFQEVRTVRDGERIVGTFRLSSVPGPFGEVYVFFADVEEGLRTRRALQESELRLSSIFQAVPVGIGLAVNRTIREANDHLCQITGYSRDELIGMPTRAFYADDEEYERAGKHLGEEECRSGHASFETRWRRKDGRFIDVYMGTASLFPQNPAAGVTFSLLDITERIRAEAERRELEERLRQAQKLESLGVLAGGIAHDFNNILMAVLGHAGLADAQLSPASPAHESLQEIQRAARRAADLCRQMLAYAGKGRMAVQALDINEVITEMEHMLQVSISKKSILQLRLGQGLPAVEVDVAQVRQVVMNLVMNASEAIGETGGIITVSTDAAICDRARLSSALGGDELAEGRFVRLIVTDTGSGMDEATRGRIFEPFYTTKFTGRGLGLAAVLGIVRAHRGAISVESAPGSGSTFTVLFPASVAAAQRLGSGPAREPTWRGSGVVLLADDEESVRAVGEKMLGALGFEALLAADGRQALERFIRHRDEIVCAIIDLSMPTMDGEETFAEIHRLAPTLPVILCSGYNEAEAVKRFLGKGLAGFLHKPYELAHLQRAMRQALGQR